MNEVRENPRRRRWHLVRYLPSVVVLGAGVLGGGRVADTLADNARREAAQLFDETVDGIVLSIDQDLENYLVDLSDIATFTGTHDPPSPEDFDWFIDQSRYLDPEARQVLIYVERVDRDELVEFTTRERAEADPDLIPLSMHYGADGPMMFITRSKSESSIGLEIPMVDVSSLILARDAMNEAAQIDGPVALDLDAVFEQIVDPSGPLAASGLDIEGVMTPILRYVGSANSSPGTSTSPGTFGYAIVVPVHPSASTDEVSGWIIGGLDPPNLLRRFSDELGITVQFGDGPIIASTEGPPVGEEFHRAVQPFESDGLHFQAQVVADEAFGLPAGAFSTAGVARTAGYSMAGLLALLLAVRTVLRHRTQEMQGQLDDTSHRARHDPLTGLMNRAAMRDLLQERCVATASGMIAVLFIDLDRLKIVNDSLGHSVGDTALRAAAERLREAVGSAGVLSRFGGDEFVVVMDGLGSVDEAERLARTLTVALNAPLQTSQLELSLTASIGIACTSTELADSETLIRDADAAMYEAKGAGGNGYAVFDETLRERVTERLELENALRAAIVGDELAVYFQPIVDVEDNRIVSAEALIRWDRGELGMVGPPRFLPVANETGMIVQIGDLVADRACEMIARMRRYSPEHPIGVAINLSERELLSPRVVERIGSALTRYSVPPELLTIEINEDVVVDGHGRALDTLRMLEHLGVRLAIDDFGTGLSSLGHVKRLEMVSTIKIDKTFIRDIDVDEADQAIVSAVVAMSATLGHDVVAEGVERPEQQQTLQSLGVHVMQGYRWSPAVPADDMLALVEGSLIHGALPAGEAGVVSAAIGRQNDAPHRRGVEQSGSSSGS